MHDGPDLQGKLQRNSVDCMCGIANRAGLQSHNTSIYQLAQNCSKAYYGCHTVLNSLPEAEARV